MKSSTPLILSATSSSFSSKASSDFGKTMAPVAEKASQGAERGANSISRWVEANQNLAIALGLGTIAVGGAGVYYYLNGKPASRSSSRTKDGQNDTGADEKATGSNGAAASKKKKSKKSKRSKEGGSTTADTSRGDQEVE